MHRKYIFGDIAKRSEIKRAQECKTHVVPPRELLSILLVILVIRMRIFFLLLGLLNVLKQPALCRYTS
jgi:hypothetical protein